MCSIKDVQLLPSFEMPNETFSSRPKRAVNLDCIIMVHKDLYFGVNHEPMLNIIRTALGNTLSKRGENEPENIFCHVVQSMKQCLNLLGKIPSQ